MISRSQMNRQLYQIGGAGMQESQRDAQLSEQLQIEKAYRELVRRGLTEDEARQSIILQLSELKKMDNMPYAPSEDNDMYKNMPYAPSEDEDIMYKNMPYAPSENEDMYKQEPNLLQPGEYAGENYKGSPDMYPDYEIDFQENNNRQMRQMGGISGMGMQQAPQEMQSMQQMDAEQYRPIAEQLAQDPNQALMAIVRMLMEQGIPQEEAIKIAMQMIQAVSEGGMQEVSDDTRIEARFGGRIGYADGGISRLVDREQYGFGSVFKGVKKAVTGAVKGVTSAVKKVASSPIGQIALAVAAPYAIGAMFPGFATLGGTGMLGAGLRAGLSNLAIQGITTGKFDPKLALMAGVTGAGIQGLTQGFAPQGVEGSTGDPSAFFDDALTTEQIAGQRALTEAGVGSPSVVPPPKPDFTSSSMSTISPDDAMLASTPTTPTTPTSTTPTSTTVPTTTPSVGSFDGTEGVFTASSLPATAPTIAQQAADAYGQGGFKNFIEAAKLDPMQAFKEAGKDVIGYDQFAAFKDVKGPLDAVSKTYDLIAKNPSMVIGSASLMAMLTTPEMLPGETQFDYEARKQEVNKLIQQYGSNLGSDIKDFDTASEFYGRYRQNLGYASGGRAGFQQGGIGDIIRQTTQQSFFGTPNMMANGGRMGYAMGNSVQEGIMAAPQIANQMGMPVGNPRMNEGGVPELDYRDEGGFVPPIGIKERADDIPAMLSNNEFVFTADAVKNAGGGNTNVGAQKMYSLMKRLESGGMV